MLPKAFVLCVTLFLYGSWVVLNEHGPISWPCLHRILRLRSRFPAYVQAPIFCAILVSIKMPSNVDYHAQKPKCAANPWNTLTVYYNYLLPYKHRLCAYGRPSHFVWTRGCWTPFSERCITPHNFYFYLFIYFGSCLFVNEQCKRRQEGKNKLERRPILTCAGKVGMT